jgi:type IV secretory pathway VirJ component
MSRFPCTKIRLRCVAALGALHLAWPPAHAAHLSSKPGVFHTREDAVMIAGHPLHLTYIMPVAAPSPQFLILYATGDGGWSDVDNDMFEHLAERGFTMAGLDSSEVIEPITQRDKLVEIGAAADAFDTIIVQARQAMGLPATTPVIVTGYSRGANLVVFMVGVKNLQHHVGGAIAIALTRELDYLHAPAPEERSAALQVDAQGRLQTYPAIALAGTIPIAVIQSTGDSYVPAEEARQLFGPDSSTRRFYRIEARDHGFNGGKPELMRALDDALQWIEAAAQRANPHLAARGSF